MGTWDALLNPKIDVVIPTKSVDEWPALKSIPHNQRAAAKHGANIRWIPIESRGSGFSFSRSVNRGMAERREDADVFLLNDDCFMDDWWPMAFRSAMACHPQSRIFGALLRFPSRTVDREPAVDPDQGDMFSGRRAWNHLAPRFQHAGGYIPMTSAETLYSLIRFALWNRSPAWAARQIFWTHQFRFPGHYHSLQRGRPIHLITAAAMMITAKGVEELGCFDEQYPLGFEDADYCLRALEQGFEPVLINDATGVHFESLSTRKLEETKRFSFRIFVENWPVHRIKAALKGHRGIVHPKFCDCGSWVE